MLNLDIGSFHRIDATAVVLVLLDLPAKIPAPCCLNAADITPQVLSCDHLTAFLKHFNNFNNSNILPSSVSHKLKLYNNPLKPEGAEDTPAFAKACLCTPCLQSTL